MKIDDTLVLRLEELSRLELSLQERDKLRDSLNDILAMVEKLNELNTDGVEPLVYINEETNSRLRADEVRNEVSTAKALKYAPDKNENYFRVPKVIDL